MQLTGDRFTSETAQLGNDISTLPNFPAEIRAPAPTLPPGSSSPVHFPPPHTLTPRARVALVPPDARLQLRGPLRTLAPPHSGRAAGRPRRHEPGRAQAKPCRSRRA